MQQLSGHLLLSPSDLIGYLECSHLSHLEREVAMGRLERVGRRSDAADLLARKGDEHERQHLDRLRSDGREVVVIEGRGGLDGLRRSAERTRTAMEAGAEVIFQAVLFDGDRWHGYADFLERVEVPSALGSWSYEVADTKLATRVKPYFLLQLCCYSELLARIQGHEPEWMHVVLGTTERERFRVSEYAAYYRAAKARFEQTLAALDDASYPEPVERCGLCRWEERCEQRRIADDHLSQVAQIRRSQTVRLRERGITTMARLAVADEGSRPPRIGSETFAALREQARLQVAQRDSGLVSYELLPPEPGRGFGRLPPPSPGDLYFDMEGDPFFDGGLEYLFGVTAIEDGEPRFRAFWATTREEERQAFEDFIDSVTERRARHPDLHVYHYAPYETTALKRLMGQHGTREDAIDDLLRSHVFVDLYAVVRQALRISQPSYSIKKLETFYMDGRETDVADGGDSILAFEEFLETRDDSLLEAIERYNEDDCRSTWLLHRWLIERRAETIARDGREIPWKPDPQPRTPDPGEVVEIDALRDALASDTAGTAERGPEPRARWLLSQLLDYHRREDKPVWWEYFARVAADPADLVEVDTEALGGLRDTGAEPRQERRSRVHTLGFPAQEHKVRPGDYIDPATESGVKVVKIDDDALEVEIKRGPRLRDAPLPHAIIPRGPLTTPHQRAALRRLAADVVERGLDADGHYRALRDVLRRTLPRTSAVVHGSALQADGFDLEQAKRVVAGMQDTCLFVQGPPGSGKTHNGAHLICHLLEQGARVGVASGSHAAIHNLLAKVEEVAGAEATWRGAKRPGSGSGSGSEYVSVLAQPLITNSRDLADCTSGHYRLVAGTAWLFAREELDGTLDYLFIDEAGQIALADALAMGMSARNLVLLGDPLQLAQVSQALHPPGAGASVLEHLLGDDTTIPPERGLFIDQTRRMHPDVCSFISETVYERRLSSHPDCAGQRVEAPGKLTATGIRYLPVEHAGNVRQSPEEADVIAAAIEELRRGDHVDARGERWKLEPDDVMVVAPYNAQVRCLQDRLPAGVRIGTVDKFQGQEGVVTFFSMATSSGEELPRNLEFLFSRNRLNVAISRARCLAVLVCNPELLTVRCRNVEQLRLVSALCRLVEVADS